MRAKNEAKFLAEAYNTKLLLERVVDGTLMCPEACCGAPVMECKCAPDCPHCNCFMIQEAVKKHGLKDKRLKIPEEDNEEGERPYDINDPSTHYLVKSVGGEHGQILGRTEFQGSLKDIVAKFGDAVDDPNDPANWIDGELGIGEDAVVVSADPSDDFSSVEAYRAARGIAMPSDEEATSASFGRKKEKEYDWPWKNPRRERPDSGAGAEEWDRQNPKRTIRSFRDKQPRTDALVSARSRETLGDPDRRHFGFQPVHKPYISSFVDDDRNKIVAAIGSDGKIVHEVINGKSVPKKWPVRDKQKAYKWLKDNYEDI